MPRPGSLLPLPDTPGQIGERTLRPWGWYETVGTGSGHLIKRLWLDPGRRICLQRHRHRCEHWVVVEGSGQLECEGSALDAAVGTTLFIPLGAVHRATAAANGLLIVEVQRGEDLREEDIERLEDDYGRS